MVTTRYHVACTADNPHGKEPSTSSGKQNMHCLHGYNSQEFNNWIIIGLCVYSIGTAAIVECAMIPLKWVQPWHAIPIQISRLIPSEWIVFARVAHRMKTIRHRSPTCTNISLCLLRCFQGRTVECNAAAHPIIAMPSISLSRACNAAHQWCIISAALLCTERITVRIYNRYIKCRPAATLLQYIHT